MFMYITPAQRGIIFLVLVTLVAAVFAVIYNVQINPLGLFYPEDEAVVVEDKNRLTNTTATAEDIAGTLFFVGARDVDGERSSVSYAYRLPLNTDTIQVEVPALSYSYLAGARGFDFLIAQDTSLPIASSMQPAVYDPREEYYVSLEGIGGYRVRHLAVTPNETIYAYAYQENVDVEPFDLAQWNIAIHDFKTGNYQVLEGATKPQFIGGGQEMYHIQGGGLAVYDISIADTSLVTDQFSGLGTVDDFAVTDDGSRIVVTVPSLNLISIQERSPEGDFEEKGRIVTSGVRYYHPLISPDGQYYATVASHYNKRNGKVEKTELEFRHIEGMKVLKTVEVSDFDPEGLEITSWQSE